MNNNLDNWLNSLEMEATVAEHSAPAVLADAESHAVAAGDLPPEPQSLSNQDFDDILEDFGFNRPEDVELEEVEEEPIDPTADDEDWEEEEGRDLDAEEDADWQVAIDNGTIREAVANVITFVEGEAPPDAPDGTSWINHETGELMMRVEGEDVPIAMGATEESIATAPVELEPLSSEAISSEATAPTVQEEEQLLPLNSPTLLLDESTSRFSGAEWFNEIQRKAIIVAGQGGIGSNLTFQLARMHPRALYLYDDDMVEAVNMAGQLYARNDIGKSKVAAISDMISAYTNMQNIYALKEKFTEHTEAANIMMCGFDNMEARRIFFNVWQSHVWSLPEDERKNCLFLDGRLSIDTLQVLCITGEDNHYMEEYRDKYLFWDSEADHTVCSMKQTTYLACMIGSIMVNLFTNFVANSLNPIIPYDLPFFTEYDAQNMIFKTVK